MAVKAIYLGAGKPINDAYFKISRIEGSKEAGLNGQFGIYLDKASRDLNGKVINTDRLTIPWDGTGNPYNLLYAALKLVYTDGTDI